MPQLVEPDTQVTQSYRRDAAAFKQKAQKNISSPNRRAFERSSFPAGELKGPAGAGSQW